MGLCHELVACVSFDPQNFHQLMQHSSQHFLLFHHHHSQEGKAGTVSVHNSQSIPIQKSIHQKSCQTLCHHNADLLRSFTIKKSSMDQCDWTILVIHVFCSICCRCFASRCIFVWCSFVGSLSLWCVFCSDLWHCHCWDQNPPIPDVFEGMQLFDAIR